MPDTNIPVIDLAGALQPDRLAAWLEYELAAHAANTNALTARFEKFLTVTQDGIRDEAMAGHASDFAKELGEENKATDATRKRIKDPVLHAQRLIDGEAKKLTDRLSAAAATVTTRITRFLQQKEARARLAAEIEAARLAHEAEARLAEAQQSATIEAADAAVEAMHEADQAAALAAAKPLELSRTRSAGGALAGLKETWTYEVINLDLLPAAYRAVNDAAAKAAIKNGVREIPGLRIYAETKAMIR